MVENIHQTHPKGDPPGDEPPSAIEAASYIYLTVRELAAMARSAGLVDVAEALGRAGNLSAVALGRFGKDEAG